MQTGKESSLFRRGKLGQWYAGCKPWLAPLQVHQTVYQAWSGSAGWIRLPSFFQRWRASAVSTVLRPAWTGIHHYHYQFTLCWLEWHFWGWDYDDLPSGSADKQRPYSWVCRWVLPLPATSTDGRASIVLTGKVTDFSRTSWASLSPWLAHVCSQGWKEHEQQAHCEWQMHRYSMAWFEFSYRLVLKWRWNTVDTMCIIAEAAPSISCR